MLQGSRTDGPPSLEELCEERGAAGNNLKERITALSKIIVLPQDLLNAADHLRLLGNDAAHIEAKTYQAIGEPECAFPST